MPENQIKTHLKIHRLMAPADFHRKAPAIKKKLPKRIPIGEWVNVGSAMQFIVWPYEPINSSIRGAVRMIQYFNYEELREKFFWKWEYYHDHGDALKIGKESGLWVYGDDPLLMPGSLISAVYYLIFYTEPSDFIGLRK